MKTLSEQLGMSRTLEDLATAMENQIKSYGFSGFVYWTHLRTHSDDLSTENAFMLSRGPVHLKAFEAFYLAKQFYLDDPVVKAAANYTVPFTTCEARTQMPARSRWQRCCYTLEQSFGFAHDINIPVHTPLRIQVFCAYFLGDDPAFPALVKELLPTLQLDVALFAGSVTDFIDIGGSDKSSNIMLSVREQECLAWLAKGRSNGDIAIILDISERTVKFHVKNIMEKLNADNRTHAVAIAARSGWIPN